MTTTIVISQENNKNHIAEPDDNIPLEKSITCLCTDDEQCNGNTSTCQLSYKHHTCYQSWTCDPTDGSVHLTAG